ncbi:NirA family protein [Humisphaera borealis]|uniref:NirA family protein n=1 Tax=Humisphaera borealis TaxID=2807512 RepID=A0A7M2WW06_9BACT|nr:NirA family protein [Humisphaera borealis]QOV89559.1 NirA family protein [Humisphaera borealis]
MSDFSDEQKHYLQGFVAGSGLTQLLVNGRASFATALGLPANGSISLPGGGSEIPPGPEAVHYRAQDAQVAAGKKLCPEEVAKRKKFPLDQWNDLVQHSAEGKFPKGTDVLAFKYQGLFYVAPAQDSYMARLRFAGGIVPSFQFRRVAELAEVHGGGFSDVTTRANLQIREIQAGSAIDFLEGLHDAGILCRGSGADNIRNVTGSPTAGIDPQELIDTRPLSRAMHHYILNHREMYGLPRKFNIAFDGGGKISAVEDTNDIGFSAVRVGQGKTDSDGQLIEPGVYFRLALGGITGHKDFAKDQGVLLKPDECISVAAAIVRVFIDNGDRTDRKKARLKYVLDRWGHAKYIEETEKVLGRKLRKVATAMCEPRPAVDKHGHIGVFPQKQEGRFYVGVVLPVGRITAEQMRGIADIADKFGSGMIRLTVWQNLLISDIAEADIPAVQEALAKLNLATSATSIRAGLVACTGAAGCKFAMAHTKQHAMALAEALEKRIELDVPVNIHLTGCPNSCAQHYMGDIGLIGTKVSLGDDDDAEEVEGYHVFVGGGYGADQSIGRELYRNIPATELAKTVEKMIRGYKANRTTPTESFNEFVRRHETDQLKEIFDAHAVTESEAVELTTG